MNTFLKSERKRLRSDRFRREVISMSAILFSLVGIFFIFLGVYSKDFYIWLDSIHPLLPIIIVVPLLGLFGLMRLKKMIMR